MNSTCTDPQSGLVGSSNSHSLYDGCGVGIMSHVIELNVTNGTTASPSLRTISVKSAVAPGTTITGVRGVTICSMTMSPLCACACRQASGPTQHSNANRLRNDDTIWIPANHREVGPAHARRQSRCQPASTRTPGSRVRTFPTSMARIEAWSCAARPAIADRFEKAGSSLPVQWSDCASATPRPLSAMTQLAESIEFASAQTTRIDAAWTDTVRRRMSMRCVAMTRRLLS